MSSFDLEVVDRLLTTTRAVRRRLDLQRPVRLDVVKDCLRVALQAPTGSNRQSWRWIVVSDAATRRDLAELYRNPPAEIVAPRDPDTGGAEASAEQKLDSSASYLRQHLHEVPVLVVPCIQNGGGAAGWAPSIYPAVWSFMLALRSRGLGSVLTTVHLYRRAEADALLGVPADFVQACLLPVAYTVGEDFRPANRRPVEEVAFHDRWDRPLT